MDIDILPAASTRGQYLHERLLSINRSAADLILENGTILREIRTTAVYREWGDDSFDAAIDRLQDEGRIDYGSRQARNFIAIVDMFESLQLGPADIKTLGISKLREVASVRGVDEQRRLIEEAKHMSVADVQKAAKAIRDKAAGRDVDPLDCYTLKFSASLKAFFKECLAVGRLVYSLNDDVPAEAVLEAILADWRSEHMDVDQQTGELLAS